MHPTPEFVLWSLELGCPLRYEEAVSPDHWYAPEYTERLLRPVHAAGEARREGRVVEEIALHETALQDEEPTGFSLPDVLAAFGGEDDARATCNGCPANAEEELHEGALAGCYGWIVAPHDADALHAQVDRVLARLEIDAEQPPLKTHPQWYGLWSHSPLEGRELALLQRLAQGMIEAGAEDGWRHFHAATGRALEHCLPMHVALAPPGVVDSRRWKTPAHCRRCKAVQAVDSRRCTVCGLDAHPLPPRSRCARGRRPYRRLAEFLPAARIEALLETHRRKQSSAVGATTKTQRKY